MSTSYLFIDSKTVLLPRAIPYGTNIKLVDLAYGVNTRAEFFKMRIRGFIPSPDYYAGLSKGRFHDFRIPMNEMTFEGLKKACYSQCPRIPENITRELIRDILHRFRQVGNKLSFKDTGFIGTFPIFKIQLSEDLAIALGLPAQRCSVDSHGVPTFSRFLKNCDKNTPQGFMHFSTRKLVGVRCNEIDLSKHFDNSLTTFFIKKGNSFCIYKELDRPTSFNLTPTTHNSLTFTWPDYLHIKSLTIALEAPAQIIA